MPTVSDTETNHEFESHCHTGAELFAVKDKKYMSAYKGTGLLGVACEIIGICRRLLPLVVWAPDRGRVSQKSLVGILTDLHNYSVMALMCIDDNNWDGRPFQSNQGETSE